MTALTWWEVGWVAFVIGVWVLALLLGCLLAITWLDRRR